MQFGLLAAAGGGEMSVPEFLLLLIAVLVAAKVLGELAERIGQPAVLGELAAGVLLGPSLLGVVDPGLPVLHLLAEVGVILLLFQIGLETDLRQLIQVGAASTTVALTGVVIPFALGFAVARMFGLELLASLVLGAALTATSVGITARVLSDLGRLDIPESRIVLGAAVMDDVIGLVILAVVSEMVAGGTVTAGGIAVTTVTAFGFLAATLVVGRLAAPPVFRVLERVGRPDTLATMALAMAFLLAYLADAAGSALIIGAFAAGLILQPTPQAHAIEKGTIALGHLFVPIFFVSVGAAVDVRTFLDPFVISLGLALIAVAVAGKFVAGFAPFWFRGKKSVIGVGMVPRGEVGLIFAQMGRSAGVLGPGLFSALALMVMVTTFLAPPLLKLLLSRAPGAPQGPTGVAEMVTEA